MSSALPRFRFDASETAECGSKYNCCLRSVGAYHSRHAFGVSPLSDRLEQVMRVSETADEDDFLLLLAFKTLLEHHASSIH